MRATVLVVDDEAPLLRAMQRLLGRAFDVHSASGMRAALEAVTEHTALVVTDFSMPDGNGLQLAAALRQRGFARSIAILSAVVESEELQHALGTGVVDALLTKPWKSDELLARVTTLCHTRPPVAGDPEGALRPAAA